MSKVCAFVSNQGSHHKGLTSSLAQNLYMSQLMEIFSGVCINVYQCINSRTYASMHCSDGMETSALCPSEPQRLQGTRSPRDIVRTNVNCARNT